MTGHAFDAYDICREVYDDSATVIAAYSALGGPETALPGAAVGLGTHLVGLAACGDLDHPAAASPSTPDHGLDLNRELWGATPQDAGPQHERALDPDGASAADVHDGVQAADVGHSDGFAISDRDTGEAASFDYANASENWSVGDSGTPSAADSSVSPDPI
jgi:hypothetical protein